MKNKNMPDDKITNNENVDSKNLNDNGQDLDNNSHLEADANSSTTSNDESNENEKADEEETREDEQETSYEYDDILGGMREVIEYSESKSTKDDKVYVNDVSPDDMVEVGSKETYKKKSLYRRIRGSKFIRKAKLIQRFLYKKMHLVMDYPFRTCLILAFISEMFIESMSRRSLFDAVEFLFTSPIIFGLNFLIVLAPFLIALLVKRKLLPYFIFLAMWAVVGIADFYMLSYRTTPFTGVDIDFDVNELAVAFKYLEIYESILIILGLLVAFVLIFLLMFICPKSKVMFGSRIKAVLFVGVFWLLSYKSIMSAIDLDILSLKFGNLAITYHEEGIAYSLLVTIVDTGMSKSPDYSEEKIDSIKSEYNDKKTDKEEKELPNIIFIQLESFIDPLEVEGVEYSEDPMPYYRSLRKRYSSGYLTVPTIVAGTCNTEFEVITGMNLGFFGAGEYPYKTILKETTCESMAYDMKQLGYTAHAIHNNKATFYGRNLIYSHFGFDTFTSIENMTDVEETPNGWAKDAVLTKCITDCLDSTEGKDLVYTVSVQCHGTYTPILTDEEAKIKVSGIEDETLSNSFTYYVNEVKEVDDFIRQLIKTLSEYDEDIVLVMYGDHIPGLSLSNDIMKNNNIYTTEYVIWDNMGLEKKDQDITSYQLAAEVFDRVNIHEGNIFKFHQTRYKDKDQDSYQADFYNLQYDMLYGDRNVYGGTNPYEATDIVFGVNEVVIDKISMDAEHIYIEGSGFNKFSKVFINDDKKDVELISSTLLKVDIDDIEEGAQIIIKQINSAGTTLRESQPYIYFY